MRPINTVNGEGFIEMMNFVEPEYCLPSPSTFMKAIENMYTAALSSYVKIFKVVIRSVSLSSAMEAYLGVTAHLITEICNHMLVVVKPLEGHTAENIVQWNMEIFDNFYIAQSKVSAIVHDNGSNMVAAVRDLKEQLLNVLSIRCAGHTLQLCLIYPLEYNVIHRTIAAARALVMHFERVQKH